MKRLLASCILTLSSIMAYAAVVPTPMPASPETTSTDIRASTAPTNRIKCQVWQVAGITLTATPSPVLTGPDPFPNNQCKRADWDGRIEWHPPVIHVLGIPIPVPPYSPSFGDPFSFNTNMTAECRDADYPYMRSFKKGWAGNFNAGGAAWFDDVYCCKAPSDVPMVAYPTWKSNSCT